LGSEEETDAERDVVQAAYADGFVVLVFPEPWEGGENQVHEPVQIGHVYCEDLDDDLRSQKLEGSD